MRRILVLRGGALGDFIVTLPALALLRARWPAATIELAGNATAAALAVPRGLLNTVHSQHERCWSHLYGAEPLPPGFAAWLAEFDLVVNYWPDPDGNLRRHFPCRPGQRFVSAEAMPQRSPAAAHYCAALAPLGLEPPAMFFLLRAHALAGAATTGPIFVHPGSGSPRKNWPSERWRELLQCLAGPVSLVLGEAEAALWHNLKTPGVVRLVQAPLEELVTQFSRCRLFLGHDSGISHLAAACGAPCLLLFGPTDPARWAPPADHVRVMRHAADLASISVAEVRAAVSGRLAERG